MAERKHEGRITLSLNPSVARTIRQLAYLSGKSLNEFIGAILNDVAEQNVDALKDFTNAENSARSVVKLSYPAAAPVADAAIATQ